MTCCSLTIPLHSGPVEASELSLRTAPCWAHYNKAIERRSRRGWLSEGPLSRTGATSTPGKPVQWSSWPHLFLNKNWEFKRTPRFLTSLPWGSTTPLKIKDGISPQLEGGQKKSHHLVKIKSEFIPSHLALHSLQALSRTSTVTDCSWLPDRWPHPLVSHRF